MRRYKLESRDVKGAAECMRISGFVHRITNRELIKRLHDKIQKTVDEMMRVTTSFLRRKVAAWNHERKKSFPPWKQQVDNHKQNFKKGGFRNQQRPKKKQDRFILLTKTPKEIFALEKGKFKALPLKTTLVKKQNHTKFCEFHGEVGHNMDECMHLKKQIEEMLKAGKLSHLIKELKQNSGKEQPKAAKKGETFGKDKALAILMEGTEGPMITEAEIGGHYIHCIRFVPPECVLVAGLGETLPATKPNFKERVKVAINPEYPEQAVMIGSTFTEGGRNKLCGLLQEDSLDTVMEMEKELPEPWILSTDGSSCTDGSGARLILTNPEGMEFTYALRFRFKSTNNKAEYEALITGLRIVEQMGVKISRQMSIHDWWPTKNPQQQLTPITSPWPFYKWGIDIAGPFPEGPGKVKFLIVTMDYFTKWIEAKPVATITDNQVKKICGTTLSVDSDSQERSSRIMKNSSGTIHSKIGARNYAFANPLLLLSTSKPMIWLKEQIAAHCIMIKFSNGDTPFSLTYGTETIIPVEIGMPTLRTAEVDLVQNNEALEINLDLLEERREQAAIREAKSKAKMVKYYNSKVRNTSFKPGDLVYRNNDASCA
nr:reverse transcriptase domain-containing protein [Tanacetum cinerariifolium]